jgi:hypothetical protein
MVFYVEPRGYGPGKNDFLIYVGRDKFENEDLIRYGLPHDIWCGFSSSNFLSFLSKPVVEFSPTPYFARIQVPCRQPLLCARLPSAAQGHVHRRHPGW